MHNHLVKCGLQLSAKEEVPKLNSKRCRTNYKYVCIRKLLCMYTFPGSLHWESLEAVPSQKQWAPLSHNLGF